MTAAHLPPLPRQAPMYSLFERFAGPGAIDSSKFRVGAAFPIASDAGSPVAAETDSTLQSALRIEAGASRLECHRFGTIASPRVWARGRTLIIAATNFVPDRFCYGRALIPPREGPSGHSGECR